MREVCGHLIPWIIVDTLCDKANAGGFSCRDGNCSSFRVEVYGLLWIDLFES